MERVYLDMCSLKRPFEDPRHPRVREEATAVAAIVARVEAGQIALVRSAAHLIENDANPQRSTCCWTPRSRYEPANLSH